MMADDLESELSALEDAAPVTPEAHEQPDVRVEDAAPEGEGAENAEQADEWKPPSKDHWENLEKARRADREALREQRRQNQIYQQNIQRMQERFEQAQQQQIMQRLQAPPPDPYAQPDEARAWQQQQAELSRQFFAQEQQRVAQMKAAQQQEQQFAYLNSEVESYENEFRAQNPDYDEATDHLLGMQQRLLEGMGYSPDQANAVVADFAMRVTQQALQAGRDPAKTAYEMAREMGYVPKAQRQAQAATATAAEKLANMKAGQESAKTLSGGGAGAKGGTSLKQIAGLEGAAFDSAMDKWLTDAIRGR